MTTHGQRKSWPESFKIVAALGLALLLSGCSKHALQARVESDDHERRTASQTALDEQLPLPRASLLKTETLIAQQGMPYPHLREVVFSSDGSRVAGFSFDTISVWETASGNRLASLVTEKDPPDLALNEQGDLLTTASRQGKVTIWQIPECEILHTLDRHQGEVASVTFSPDGRLMATTGLDQTVNIWDVESGSFRASVTVEGVYDNVGLKWTSFSEDSRKLAVLSRGGAEIQVWDVRGNQTSDRFSIPNVAPGGILFTVGAYSANWSPDGSRLALPILSDRLDIFDFRARGMLAYPAENRYGTNFHTNRGNFRGSVFSPDGRYLAAFTDSAVTVWDVNDGREVLEPGEFDDWVLAAAFSPDGSRLMAAARDGTLKVWSLPLPVYREERPGTETSNK